MSESLWIIDPDPTSAQALRNAVDLLGPSVETFASVPTEGAAPQAVLIAGVNATEIFTSMFVFVFVFQCVVCEESSHWASSGKVRGRAEQ